MRANIQTIVVSCFAIATLLALSPAGAHAQGLNDSSFQVERFEPLPGQGSAILNVAKSNVMPHGMPSLGLFLHYMDDPLVLQQPDGSGGFNETPLMSHSLKAEVMASIGLFDVFDLGIVAPLVVYQEGGDLAAVGQPGEELDSFDLQDIRIIPRLQLLDHEDLGGLGAAFLIPFSVPVGGPLNGETGVRIEPRLAVDFRRGDFTIAANAAWSFRDQTEAQDYVSNDVFRWSLGLEVPTGVKRLAAIATVFGDIHVTDERDPDNLTVRLDTSPDAPIEWLAGVQYSFDNDLVANLGGGTGLTSGIGSPDFRVFASLGYTPRMKDTDGDGILDRDDACPTEPGPLSNDGCPILDSDEDGIPDDVDQCPEQPEDFDGFEDEDGCPDPDNDGDGVPDAEDRCPNISGVAANDGCPLVDGDGDGIPDEDDQCPDRAEDFDGFEDEDGCPDPDNDGDGIPDVDDQCPDDAETFNGVDDEDGCPDEGETKVRVTERTIEILERVFFDTAKSTIQERSFDLLNQVAAVLNANPKITKVRIDGHTDDRGSKAFNQKLSEDRAASVRAYLVAQGVDEDRLSTQGFGPDKPIETNDTAAGREKNRRVEFSILEVNGEPIGDGPAVIREEVTEE